MAVTEAPRTAKGRETRKRIVSSASHLIRSRGVAATSLDDVIEEAGVSKSQLYHYFSDREDLLRAVVAHNCEHVLANQGPELGRFDTWKEIRAWLDKLVRLQAEREARGGCPLGSLVGQLAESDYEAREELVASFARWETEIREGLSAMQARGRISRRTDLDKLATATLAAIQGGLVLAQARRDPWQLQVAVDAAYEHLRRYAS